MKTKLILMIISLLMPLSAVSANTDNDSEDAPPFPFAKGTLDANGKTTATSRIQAGVGNGQKMTVKGHLTPQIKAARGTGYDELLDQMELQGKSLLFFSNSEFGWANSTFELERFTNLKRSAVAKSFASEKKEKSKINASWKFARWNEFQFKGKLKAGYIETQ